MTARYRVLERCFIAPHMLEVGSIIETDAEASGYLEPLNAEAEDALDAWRNKEYQTRDADGKIVKHKPNLNKGPLPAEDGEQKATVVLIAAPPPDTSKPLSLAESNAVRAEPDLIPQGDGTSALNIPGAEKGKPAPTNTDAAPTKSVDEKTTILHAAPAPKKD